MTARYCSCDQPKPNRGRICTACGRSIGRSDRRRPPQDRGTISQMDLPIDGETKRKHSQGDAE